MRKRKRQLLRSSTFRAVLVLGAFLLIGCLGVRGDQLKFAVAVAARDKITVAKLLSGGKVDVNSQNGTAGPAIINASYLGDAEIVTLLLDNGANVNITDDEGSTALVSAIVGGHPRVVQLLLENGADVNTVIREGRDGNAMTALTFARNKNDTEIIKLVELYAKPTQ